MFLQLEWEDKLRQKALITKNLKTTKGILAILRHIAEIDDDFQKFETALQMKSYMKCADYLSRCVGEKRLCHETMRL